MEKVQQLWHNRNINNGCYSFVLNETWVPHGKWPRKNLVLRYRHHSWARGTCEVQTTVEISRLVLESLQGGKGVSGTIVPGVVERQWKSREGREVKIFCLSGVLDIRYRLFLESLAEKKMQQQEYTRRQKFAPKDQPFQLGRSFLCILKSYGEARRENFTLIHSFRDSVGNDELFILGH